jgi:hypothetical protein
VIFRTKLVASKKKGSRQVRCGIPFYRIPTRPYRLPSFSAAGSAINRARNLDCYTIVTRGAAAMAAWSCIQVILTWGGEESNLTSARLSAGSIASTFSPLPLHWPNPTSIVCPTVTSHPYCAAVLC